MKPVLSAVVAMVLYAIANVVMEHKLSKFNTVALLTCWESVMLALALVALGYQKIAGQPLGMPTGGLLLLTLGMGVIYFAADFMYIGAYTGGGSLLTVTAIVIMFPALAVAIKYLWAGGGLPNGYQVASYTCGALAVLLAVKGSLPR